MGKLNKIVPATQAIIDFIQNLITIRMELKMDYSL